MFVRDIMTPNVVVVPSSTTLDDARRIMKAHNFRRLPVVDKNKLVGIVTESRLDKTSPSKATSLSIWELNYILAKTPVREIMEKEVVTVTPDMTVEESVTVAQNHKVGALVVIEDGKVVGIVTTNDFFYRIVNPILGIGKPGSRITIHNCCQGRNLEEAISIINRSGANILTLFTIARSDEEENDLIVHLGTDDVSGVISELHQKGYAAEVRAR